MQPSFVPDNLSNSTIMDRNSSFILGQSPTSSSNFSLLEEHHSCNQSAIGDNAALEFRSLQYSLFITCFVEVLGGLFFLMTAWYIISDKNKCDRTIANSAGGQLMPDDPSSSQTDDDDDDAQPSSRMNYP